MSKRAGQKATKTSAIEPGETNPRVWNMFREVSGCAHLLPSFAHRLRTFASGCIKMGDGMMA